MDETKVRQIIDDTLSNARYGVAKVPYHIHNNIDSPFISSENLKGIQGIPTGTIMPYAGTTAPSGYVLADGSALSRTTYKNLFTICGVAYGSGDGSTTFNVPDLRGRVPVGKNAATFSTLGATGGTETETLSIAQIPPHTHSGNVGSGSVGGGYAAGSAQTYNPTTGSTGGGGSHNNIQPYQVINYVIKT